MDKHLSSNSLYLPIQFAYCKFHLTKQALLANHMNITVMATAIMFLGISAAFDTDDCTILLHHQDSRALIWHHLCSTKIVESYIQHHNQCLCVTSFLPWQTSTVECSRAPALAHSSLHTICMLKTILNTTCMLTILKSSVLSTICYKLL